METQLFELALNISSPFFIESVDFQPDSKRLTIHINFKRGSKFDYMQGGKSQSCKAFDTKIKKWRHLNFFEHECYLHVRVARIKLEDGKVRQISMPWEGKSKGFTLLFEALLIQLCKYMPINQVGTVTNVSDDKLWTMLDRYVEIAREHEDFKDVVSIGVDETSKKKRHDYITLFVDMITRKTIFVTQGKSNKTVVNFVKD